MPLGEDRNVMLKEVTILRYLYTPIPEVSALEDEVCFILTDYHLPFNPMMELVTSSTNSPLRLHSLIKDIMIF